MKRSYIVRPVAFINWVFGADVCSPWLVTVFFTRLLSTSVSKAKVIPVSLILLAAASKRYVLLAGQLLVLEVPPHVSYQEDTSSVNRVHVFVESTKNRTTCSQGLLGWTTKRWWMPS